LAFTRTRDRIGRRGLRGLRGARQAGRRRASIAIEQGYEMGRPSVIGLGLVVAAGKLVSASVGGDAVIVTEGTLEA
jgi:trans-2,3-dihydro-3-hydroxyanthranilate isomerase